MPKLLKISLILLITGFLFTSCSKMNYNQVAKSNNMDLKYTKAKEYYDKGKYEKAMPLFEELITVYKGSKSIDEIYYLFAMCNYKLANYLIAAFHFKNIHDSYPLSQYAEESLFMNAYCLSLMSPDVPLDQTNTTKAIEAFQLFVNSYPNSNHIAESNQKMSLLRRKLEVKSMSAAELYFRIGHYKAAAVSFDNILKDFPDTRDAERIRFFIIKSYYLYAEKSVLGKREERYTLALKAYDNFIARHGASSGYSKDALKYRELVQNKLKKLKEPVNKS